MSKKQSDAATNLEEKYEEVRQLVALGKERGFLSYEEIMRLAQIFFDHGVRKVRLTGGEPLIRRGLADLVRMLADEPNVQDLSLTTNGVLLEGAARALADAGLQRINVSLDSLIAERYRDMTRRDDLDRALAGIEAAADAGMAPIKINTVLLRGVNEDETESLVQRARERGWELRFIEFMPLENGGTWNLARVVSGAEVRKRIAARWPIEPDPATPPHAPARRYRFKDGAGSVGFIDSVTAPFCADCSRLRLTSDGKFRVCLFDPNETDLKTALRAGAPDATLARLIEQAVLGKGRGGALEILEQQAALPLKRTMHQIGG